MQGKMSFRYRQLCGTASDAVGAVRSAIPKGFKFAIKIINTIIFEQMCPGGRGVKGIKKQPRRRLGGIKQGKSDIYRMLDCVQP